MTNHRLFLLLAALAFVTVSSAKKNRNAPHGHTGLLSVHKAGNFDLDLEDTDEKQLNGGKPVMKQVEGDAGGGAVCVQDIEAPPDAVWNQILMMEEYKGKVPKVQECTNYVVKKNEDGSFTVKTKQRLGILPGYSVCSFRFMGVAFLPCRQHYIFITLTHLVYLSTRTTTITRSIQKRIQ